MENVKVSRVDALTGLTLGIPVSRRAGMLPGAGAFSVLALFAGWQWFGSAAMVPLLYTLPCAAMMMMCMRGHGGTGNSAMNSNSGTESGSDKTW
jgi:hypothetical protein